MSERGPDGDGVRVAFVCVQNAGRSQMSTAFAEHERAERGLDDDVVILSGGTHPADHVHDEVVTVMDEEGIDLSDRVPREITTAELESCDYVATMGCSTLELDAGGDAGGDGVNEGEGHDDEDDAGIDVRDWALDDPDGEDLDAIREIRETIRERVRNLFDEIERRVHTQRDETEDAIQGQHE